MGNYVLHDNGKQLWLTFPQLDRYPELVHVFTTRHGGVSTGPKENWNFGKGPDESWDNIFENYRILAEVLSEVSGRQVDRGHMVRTDQTHTANVLAVTEDHLGMGIIREREYKNIDGLVTNLRGVPLITSHGDCNALLFYDPKRQVIGQAHSGWKGTLKEIGREVIRVMKQQYGCHPEDVIAGIGPALCQDCFEVDEDVAQMFFEKNGGWRKLAYQRGNKHYINLKAVVRETLLGAGMKAENIHDMELCTRCRPDLFFSYRGQKGKNGNMVAAMMLKE